MRQKPKSKKERIEKKLEDIRRGKFRATPMDVQKLKKALKEC
jgi:hypothetical protein